MQNKAHANNHGRLVVGMVWNTPVLSRHPRRRQSELADQAQNMIRKQFADLRPEAAISRTHCRGLSAACLAPPGFSIGIDVEWMDERRNWPGIIAIYAPSISATAHSQARLVCAWVFIEAFYKAEQRHPAEAEILEMLTEFTACEEQIALASGGCVCFRQLPSDMLLCLYWRHDTGKTRKLEISFLEAKAGDNVAGKPGEKI